MELTELVIKKRHRIDTGELQSIQDSESLGLTLRKPAESPTCF